MPNPYERTRLDIIDTGSDHLEQVLSGLALEIVWTTRMSASGYPRLILLGDDATVAEGWWRIERDPLLSNRYPEENPMPTPPKQERDNDETNR